MGLVPITLAHQPAIDPVIAAGIVFRGHDAGRFQVATHGCFYSRRDPGLRVPVDQPESNRWPAVTGGQLQGRYQIRNVIQFKGRHYPDAAIIPIQAGGSPHTGHTVLEAKQVYLAARGLNAGDRP
jgi:hypothetical protein